VRWLAAALHCQEMTIAGSAAIKKQRKQGPRACRERVLPCKPAGRARWCRRQADDAERLGSGVGSAGGDRWLDAGLAAGIDGLRLAEEQSAMRQRDDWDAPSLLCEV
jgi:hypothetical protein